MAPHDPMAQRRQLADQRRKVDFDTYDVTVDELIRRVERRRIEIAPVYQRQFRWDEPRQSRLIESILLGIPVPPLFMATNTYADEHVQWEVVDGLQRLLTLVNFAGSESAREIAGLTDAPLKLEGLHKLTDLVNCRFGDLPQDIRSTLEDRPMKVIVLNDKSDLQVRFDLFERLNTGGIKLTDQEVRECVYRGEFMDFVVSCAANENFRSVLRLPASRWKDGTPQDFALRFFAFFERYSEFEHSVQSFINEFAEAASQEPRTQERGSIFTATFDHLCRLFPDGIKSRRGGVTPVNLFEAVAVGAAHAISLNPALPHQVGTEWVHSEALRRLTTGPTNSRPRVAGRIEYCRDRFLGLPENV